jgi:hypothetical protein
MRLSARPPARDPARERHLLDEGWVLLEEPRSTAAALILSAPFMLLAACVTLGLAALFVPVSPAFFGLGGGTFSVNIGLPAIFAIIGVAMLHELVHLAAIPRTARAGRTYLGITWAGLFVVCEEELARSRHLLISIAPFLAISVGGTIALGALGLLSPLLLAALTLNALGSSVDLLTAANVLRQVPNGAVIVAAGMRTCWRG